MAELKKCPFCGSEKLKMDSKSGKIHYHEKDGMREWQHVVFSVRCNKCNARGGAVGVDLPTVGRLGDFASRKAETEKKAIEAWNNRVTEAELRANVIDEFAERVRKICAVRPLGIDREKWIVLYVHEDGTWHSLIDDVVEEMKENK